MVIILLELRYGRFKEAFMNCNSNQKKCSLWERLALQFNIISNSKVAVITASLKNKEYDLRAKYKAIRIKEGSTGNDTSSPIIYPSYWDELVSAYDDMPGLGEIENGHEDPNDVGNDKNSDKRKAVDELEVQRQQRAKPKYDVGAGLVALGDSLAKGMTGGCSSPPCYPRPKSFANDRASCRNERSSDGTAKLSLPYQTLSRTKRSNQTRRCRMNPSQATVARRSSGSRQQRIKQWKALQATTQCPTDDDE
ncbi:hypothetical protein AC1031_019541 [Aphanomyces cochlioides]|nr:hypothetical protein AC1031_019541 [Aphanomyces cochlioides]